MGEKEEENRNIKYTRRYAVSFANTRYRILSEDENEWHRKKKVNRRNTYNICSIKRITRMFLEVSRCSREKQRQRNVQKKCAAREKFFFVN